MIAFSQTLWLRAGECWKKTRFFFVCGMRGCLPQTVLFKLSFISLNLFPLKIHYQRVLIVESSSHQPWLISIHFTRIHFLCLPSFAAHIVYLQLHLLLNLDWSPFTVKAFYPHYHVSHMHLRCFLSYFLHAIAFAILRGCSTFLQMPRGNASINAL